MAKLTARGVKALTKPGRYGDGGGLYMVVRPAGSKAWVMRAVIVGRRRDIVFGRVSCCGLGESP